MLNIILKELKNRNYIYKMMIKYIHKVHNQKIYLGKNMQ